VTTLHALVLGAAQGLGEFLPISSSAHLTLIPWLLRWKDPGLTYDVALHLGTLLAVVAYFGREWYGLIREGLKGLGTEQGRTFWFIVAASVPGAIAGVAFESQAETVFRSPLVIATSLMVMGLVLWLADRHGAKGRRYDTITLTQSLAIGLCQAFAIVPGVSRSGITIAAGLALGLTREAAAKFSFMLLTPIAIGAGLLKLKDLVAAGHSVTAPFFVGIGASAVVGFLAIGLLMQWVRRSSFAPFVWYRLLLGLTVIGVYFARG
jgi:undecaprenyl-diphosphatase